MSRTIAYVFGAIMAIAGIWGLMSTPVLGIFDANTALSLLWLVLGLILLAVAAWWENTSATVLKVLGIIVAIIAVWGFVVPGDILGALTNTTADNVLHLIFAVVFLWVGFTDRSGAAMQM